MFNFLYKMRYLTFSKALLLFLVLNASSLVKSEIFRPARRGLWGDLGGETEDDKKEQQQGLPSAIFGAYYNHVSRAVSDKFAEEKQKLKEKLKEILTSAGESVKNYLAERTNLIQ